MYLWSSVRSVGSRRAGHHQYHQLDIATLDPNLLCCVGKGDWKLEVQEGERRFCAKKWATFYGESLLGWWHCICGWRCLFYTKWCTYFSLFVTLKYGKPYAHCVCVVRSPKDIVALCYKGRGLWRKVGSRPHASLISCSYFSRGLVKLRSSVWGLQLLMVPGIWFGNETGELHSSIEVLNKLTQEMIL